MGEIQQGEIISALFLNHENLQQWFGLICLCISAARYVLFLCVLDVYLWLCKEQSTST